MHSVWASLGPSPHGGRSHGATVAASARPAAAAHVRAQQPAAASIWSQPLVRTAAAAAAPAPAAELHHPRLAPGGIGSRRLEQDGRIKPLLVATSHGRGGLADAPHYDAILWPDSQRDRIPPHPDALKLRQHVTNTARPGLFDIVHEAAAIAEEKRRPRYGGSIGAADAALHPPPSDESRRLGGLSLTNMSMHVPHPEQIMPFAALTALGRPHPLSQQGFVPLRIDSIEQRWNARLGVPSSGAPRASMPVPGATDPHREQEVQTDQFRDVPPAIMQDELRVQFEPFVDSNPNSRHPHMRHDMATSPMPTSRTQQQRGLSAEAHATYTLALSPQHSPREPRITHKHTRSEPAAPQSMYTFPPAPFGTNPDAHLAYQAEHLHQYSIKALKSQLADLQKDGRALEKEQRVADKKTRDQERKWGMMIGLSPVKENEDPNASRSGLDSPLRHALLLDDEREISTQTDATLSLQHARKPRVAGRGGGPPKVPLGMTAQIEAEVAAEFAAKTTEAFGAPPPPAKRKGVAHLPTFQSHADAYRAQLREQYLVVFEAQLAAANAPTNATAGALVEARLKKLRDDTLWSANPYRSARDQRHENLSPDEAAERERQQQPGFGMPETIIGSRTATLLFVDPKMMHRQIVKPSPPPPADPATDDIPNKVVELTKRNEQDLKERLGFEIPKATFPTHSNTHRLLDFSQRGGAPASSAPTGASAGSSINGIVPPPINVAQAPPSLDDEYFEHQPPERSPLDHLGVFTGSQPMHALKRECGELDADVYKLEQTIRAMHAEFAGDSQSAAKSGSSKPSLLPSMAEMQAREAEVLRQHSRDHHDEDEQRRSQQDQRRFQQAQGYLNRMDRVLGQEPKQVRVPSPAAPSRTVSASARSAITRAQALERPASASSRRPSSSSYRRDDDDERDRSRSQLQPQRNLTHSQSDSAPGVAKSSSSKLVSALEAYLSLDVQLDALTSGFSSAPRQARTEETLHSFPSAPHDLNRPDEFTPQHLSPTFQREQQQKQLLEKQALARAEKEASTRVRPAPERFDRSQPMAESWESDLLTVDASMDEREQQQVEEMLLQEEPSRRQSQSPSPRHYAAPPPPVRRAPTPGGLRSPTSSSFGGSEVLSRVLEGEHESSRSVNSSGATRLSKLSARGSGSYARSRDDVSSSADDSHAWQESQEGDRSMIIQVGQQPYRYEDSADSYNGQTPRGGARTSRSSSGPLSPTRRGGQQPLAPLHEHRTSVVSPDKPPKLFPSGGHSGRRSMESINGAIAAGRSPPQPTIQPRSNRSAELRKAQQSPRAVNSSGGAPGGARSPKRSASASAVAAPVGRHKSAMELERERRRRMAQGGMIQPTHSRDFEQQRRSAERGQSFTSPRGGGGGGGPMHPHRSVTPRAVSQSPGFSSPSMLDSSTDRQVAEANAMMANFRALLEDVQQEPASAAAPAYYSHEPLEFDVPSASSTMARRLSDSDFAAPAIPVRGSWEEDLHGELDATPVASVTHASHRPPYDPLADSDDDDLFR